MRNVISVAVVVLVGVLLVAGCSGPQEPDPMDAIDPAKKTMTLELDRPTTAHFEGSDSVRDRYLLKLNRPGLLQVNLTWNNPEGLDRLVIQTAGGGMDTIDLLNKQEVVHSKKVDPGYHYLELIPGPAPVSYNLLVSMGAGG